MDEDIRENLKEIEKHIHDVGRMIGSTKSTVQSIAVMKECLESSAENLGRYINVQRMRDARV